MRRLIGFAVAVLIALAGARYADWQDGPAASWAPEPRPSPTGAASRNVEPAARGGDAELARAFRERQSDVQVAGAGVVERVLADDVDGDRHQRFVLGLGTGQTVLVAHNIDLAPRIDGIAVGDRIEFFGEYEWNPQGGVVHWTHHDPAGRHPDGWLRHAGRLYQ